jgi:DNA-3-methyladenine glycosylase II
MLHLQHLNKDKSLARIIRTQEPLVLEPRKHVHLQLCRSIMSQQLSTKVAAVIYGRFLELFPTKTPKPAAIAALSVEELRSIGLSYAKASYMHNVCAFFTQHKLTDARLQKMDDEELIDFLTQIKGVGRWTTEMILMFTLAREDIFAVDDLGIQQAMTKLYQLDATDKKVMKQSMLHIAEKWRPFRTYACRYLWGWKDGV